ncbi:glutamate--cysteine ligase [Halodesulfurarchaeum formicicum]|uniref:Glutamate--cysteine ligase n=1 Tax=Halodesulfurarchaeum formicicum TaxID=1873524 RepID=A0A1J1AAW9_9EURY|nr:glutamate--cysteine ligase [Halodesulfurarchaeum formicicum]APE95029.1 carboxylate-amine ligase/glutamate--cysteine ligase GCS2 [Halodesulfurarchaeum formicicum]
MANGSGTVFDEMGTLGVEEEYFVVDSDGVPVAGSDELVYENDAPPPITGDVDHELFKFVLETRTRKLDGPEAAPGAVRTVRETLQEYAAEHGFQIAAAGVHPAADWQLHEHAEKPRYRAQLDRIQYPQHRNTTAGLHVHVGVDDPEKAVWITNEIRRYLPIFLALSANSPFWNGFDTGLCSARAKIFENLPNTGMPTAFEDFAAFERFESRMLETDSIRDSGELWYDVRPHTGIGTVEIRIPDAQDRVGHVDAFVEYAHALVLDLAARYEDGESSQALRWELLDENKWRALRYGQETDLIQPDGSTLSLAEIVDREADRLGIDGIKRVFEAESGATRQRRILEESGPEALREALLIEPRV